MMIRTLEIADNMCFGSADELLAQPKLALLWKIRWKAILSVWQQRNRV